MADKKDNEIKLHPDAKKYYENIEYANNVVTTLRKESAAIEYNALKKVLGTKPKEGEKASTNAAKDTLNWHLLDTKKEGNKLHEAAKALHEEYMSTMGDLGKGLNEKEKARVLFGLKGDVSTMKFMQYLRAHGSNYDQSDEYRQDKGQFIQQVGTNLRNWATSHFEPQNIKSILQSIPDVKNKLRKNASINHVGNIDGLDRILNAYKKGDGKVTNEDLYSAGYETILDDKYRSKIPEIKAKKAD